LALPHLHQIVIPKKEVTAMLESMDNAQENTVYTFSFEMEEFDDDLPFDKTLLQIRFLSVQLLNQSAAGQRTLSDKDITGMKFYNEHCDTVGLPPLKLPF